MFVSTGFGLPRRTWSRIVPTGLVTLVLTGGMMLGLQGTAVASTPTPVPTLYVQSNPDASPLPTRKFRVQTWIVADADTGDVLAAQDPHRRMPPASTMKLLTLFSMLPRLQADSSYVATKQDATAEGSKVGLAAGSSYSVQDLYHGMFMPSGNDAASAVANAYGGWERTTKVMNSEAARLHARDTNVVNPSGLDDQNQYSSAYDMALIMREAIKRDDFLKIASLRETTVPGPEHPDGSARGEVKIWTENRLLLNGYPGTIAGKTGFTSQAGRTFVAAVRRNGRTLIVAMMHSSFATEHSAQALFDWGFANHDKVTPITQLESPDPVAAMPVPRAAQVLDVNGAPVPGKNARLPDDDVATVAATNGGVAPWTYLGWVLLVMLATIVALRVRVLIRSRASRKSVSDQAPSAAQPPMTQQPSEIDLRSVAPVLRHDRDAGTGTNPIRW